jgi:aspartate 1-decarboxylase
MAKYIVDMVGHSAFMPKEFAIPEYEMPTPMVATITEESPIKGTRVKPGIAPFDITLLKASEDDTNVKVGEGITSYDASAGTYILTNLFRNPAENETISVEGNGAKALIDNRYVIITSSGSVSTKATNAIEVEKVIINDALPLANEVVLNVTFGTAEAQVTFKNVKLNDAKTQFEHSNTAPDVTVKVKKE